MAYLVHSLSDFPELRHSSLCVDRECYIDQGQLHLARHPTRRRVRRNLCALQPRMWHSFLSSGLRSWALHQTRSVGTRTVSQTAVSPGCSRIFYGPVSEYSRLVLSETLFCRTGMSSLGYVRLCRNRERDGGRRSVVDSSLLHWNEQRGREVVGVTDPVLDQVVSEGTRQDGQEDVVQMTAGNVRYAQNLRQRDRLRTRDLPLARHLGTVKWVVIFVSEDRLDDGQETLKQV